VTALRAMAAAPEDILFLGDRRIRVERARAHRSLHVRAVPPSVLVSVVSEDCDEDNRETRWLVKTTYEGEEREEVKSVSARIIHSVALELELVGSDQSPAFAGIEGSHVASQGVRRD
jgi:hypothetical protein